MIRNNLETRWTEVQPYSLNADQKNKLIGREMSLLTRWHLDHCAEYNRILGTLNFKFKEVSNPDEIPFLPVRLFKLFDLLSIPREEIFKTMTSSGTSGQAVSQIFLDRETAKLQTKSLSRLMSDLLGKKRMPMLVIDSPSVLKDRNAFSARGAGILGFSMFGTDVTYALNDEMQLDTHGVDEFLERHREGPIFIFGFTFMVWEYFVKVLRGTKSRLALESGILLHGGGWKKLKDEAVNSLEFKSALKEVAGIDHVVNYYGMVEQTGSLYLECKQGYLHAPVFSDVIVRSAHDFKPVPHGEEGIIEVLSLIPRSYPGHALLTEDRGVIHGEDDCSCGRLGKYFSVLGRLEQAEIRGCSDTHEIK